VYDRVLNQMRERIRTRQYVMTLHAEEEMDDDNLSIFDVERGILTGRVVERQRDRITAGWKYLVEGETLGGDAVIAVARLSSTGKLVIITVYRV
jgi:hypothetical protein